MHWRRYGPAGNNSPHIKSSSSSSNKGMMQNADKGNSATEIIGFYLTALGETAAAYY